MAKMGVRTLNVLSFCTVFDINYFRIFLPHVNDVLVLNRHCPGESKNVGPEAVGPTGTVPQFFENSKND
jgi:hypothetical protein